MASITDIYGLHPSSELPTAPSTQLKNAFKPVFHQVLKDGAVSITRNRKREAILLSAELYDKIVQELAARDPLKVLREDYDARFSAMQSDAAGKSYDKAFNAGPEELGKAAVAEAAKQ